MDAFWERLSPGQIVAVVSIVTGGIVAVVMILAVTKYQLQSLADETTLKSEKQQVELALRTKLIERGGTSGVSLDALLHLDVDVPDPDGLNGELAKRFGMLDATPEEIERSLGRAMAVEGDRKKAVLKVMDELLGSHAEPEAILATVRALCSTTVAEKESPVPAMRA